MFSSCNTAGQQPLGVLEQAAHRIGRRATVYQINVAQSPKSDNARHTLSDVAVSGTILEPYDHIELLESYLQKPPK